MASSIAVNGLSVPRTSMVFLASMIAVCVFLSYFYYPIVSRCSLRQERHQTRTLENIFYLHIPKAGSSVANILIQYGCPDFPKNESILGIWSLSHIVPEIKHGGSDVQSWMRDHCGQAFRRFEDDHPPLPREIPNEDFWRENNVVSFVRHPTERILSGFLHNLHTCHANPRLLNNPLIANSIAQNVDHKATDYINWTMVFAEENRDMLRQAYGVYWNCVRGCATKMILGLPCGDNHVYDDEAAFASAEAIEESLNRLSKFAFVGITDEWEKSVDTWRFLYGGDFSEIVYHNTRPSKHPEYKDILRDVTREMGLQDRADLAVYTVARKNMYQASPSLLASMLYIDCR